MKLSKKNNMKGKSKNRSKMKNRNKIKNSKKKYKTTIIYGGSDSSDIMKQKETWTEAPCQCEWI